MRKSWLMCALLGAVAWGQAAPSAPTPAMPGKIPASAMAGPPAQAPDTAASVAPNAPVITVIGVCAPKPKPADAKGTGATPATAAKTPAAKTPAGKTPAEDCKTVITKAEFETLANNLAPNITPQQKKQLAGLLPRWIAMSDEATKKHLDRTPQFKDRLKVNRMQILSQMLQQDVQKEAAEVPEEEIDKYYKEHADSFEQFNVDRMFVPRTKQPAAESKEDQEKDKNLSEDAKKAREAAEKQAPRTMVMKRTCWSGLSRNDPANWVVMVEEPGFSTPRNDMHMCSASSMTATPRGMRISSIAVAICEVRCSWVCSRRA